MGKKFNWKRSSVLRKSVALIQRAPKMVRRWSASDHQYRATPPILANSFPKSGTHLLVQILEAFPGTRSCGGFWASMPSVTFRERTKQSMVKSIRRCVPGELVSGHLFYAPEFTAALAERNVVHFFIYRDPRDVVVSEAHYLATMNRWHRLHRYFAALPSTTERITLSITGATDPRFPYDYPNIRERFRRYDGWLERDDVFAVKFEDLISERRETCIRDMVAFYMERTGLDHDLDTIVRAALKNIAPERSHTFREGKAGSWRTALTPEQQSMVQEIAGDLLVELGYEADRNWCEAEVGR